MDHQIAQHHAGPVPRSGVHADPQIRLAFIDDHPTLRRGLVSVFDLDARYRMVQDGESADDIEIIAGQGDCDILIVDLGLPGDVFGALRRVVASSPELKIVVFTAHEDVDIAVQALDTGVHAFVLKGSPIEDLYEAIASVRRGELFVSPSFSSRVLASLQKARAGDGIPRLSGRERQLIRCLLEGKSNKEIAATLRLTEKTVKHYMTNLMGKLHVRSRLEVVIAAQRWVDGSSMPARPSLP